MNLYCSPPGQTSLAGGNRSCPDRQDSIALEIAGSHQKRDLETLEEIISADIPETLDAIDDLQEVFRIRWLCGFKPYKLNWLQILNILQAQLLSTKKKVLQQLTIMTATSLL